MAEDEILKTSQEMVRLLIEEFEDGASLVRFNKVIERLRPNGIVVTNEIIERTISMLLFRFPVLKGILSRQFGMGSFFEDTVLYVRFDGSLENLDALHFILSAVRDDSFFKNSRIKAELFRNLANMDVKKLGQSLGDSITYFGAYKKDFLFKLETIFTLYKERWKSNRLVITRSKVKPNSYYLKFPEAGFKQQFTLTDDGEKITSLKSTKKYAIENIDDLDQYEIFFGVDERADFQPSEEYNKNVNACSLALSEISNSKRTALKLGQLQEWLTKYQSLFKVVTVHWSMNGYRKFRYAYNSLYDLMAKIKIASLAKKAVLEFNDSINEKSLWLKEYDWIFYTETQGFEIFFEAVDELSDLFQYRIDPYPFISAEHISWICRFNLLFLKAEKLPN